MYAPTLPPSAVLSWYRQFLADNQRAAIEGLPMTGGATGRPAGAIRQPLGEMARRAGDILSPATGNQSIVARMAACCSGERADTEGLGSLAHRISRVPVSAAGIRATAAASLAAIFGASSQPTQQDHDRRQRCPHCRHLVEQSILRPVRVQLVRVDTVAGGGGCDIAAASARTDELVPAKPTRSTSRRASVPAG
jgi:hypothetical protein